MADLKTKATPRSVTEFIAAVEHPVRRADAGALMAMMERISGEPATMWGPSIIGFGRYHYRYDSGHEGEMCRIGFSPRAANLVLYVATREGDEAALAKLGKHKRGKGCLYINKLADIDLAALEDLVAEGWALMQRRHPN